MKTSARQELRGGDRVQISATSLLGEARFHRLGRVIAVRQNYIFVQEDDAFHIGMYAIGSSIVKAA